MTDIHPLTGRLTVLPISDHEWRISDPARRADDALCLVGFVQAIDGVFETTAIGCPLAREYFLSLDEAVASFGR
jgi:hypothetical protein